MNQNASALGKLGGSVKSAAKRKASQKNGKLGGWPKGRKRDPEPYRKAALKRRKKNPTPLSA